MKVGDQVVVMLNGEIESTREDRDGLKIMVTGAEGGFTIWVEPASSDVQVKKIGGPEMRTAYQRERSRTLRRSGTYCESCGRRTSDGPDGNDLCNACIDGQHVR